MKVLNRIHFELNPRENKGSTFDRAAAIVIEWAKTRKGVDDKLIGSLPTTVDPIEVGRGVRFEAILTSGLDGRAWGLRLSQRDGRDRSLVCISEVSLLEGPQSTVHYSCSLLLQREGHVVVPATFRPSNPGVGARLLNSLGGRVHGAFSLHAKPVKLLATPDEIEIYTKFLLSPKRTHPVVFVSPTLDRGAYLVDAEGIAKHLAGMAHVLIAENSDATRLIESRIPHRLNCFAGALRIYWPGLRRHDNPFRHPLILPEVLLEMKAKHPQDAQNYLLAQIAEVAAFSVAPHFLSWSDLEGIDRRVAIERAREEGKQDELLELFEAENHRVEGEKAALKESLQIQSDKITRLANQVESYRQLLVNNGINPADARIAQAPPATVQEAITQAIEAYADRLAFAFNGKSEHESCPYNDPESVFEALSWLATTFVEAKTGEVPNANLEEDFRNAVPGWEYRPHQKKNTMNNHRWRSWYHTRYDNREIALPAHFRNGTGTDPRECIRIAFQWDDATERAVVGFIGQHQENTMSS